MAGTVINARDISERKEAVRRKDDWVADQGLGIPPEALPKLCSMFFRVEHHETRYIGGTGLDLALVKEIVAAHNGSVWVESTVGQGSTFFFTVPVAPSAVSPCELRGRDTSTAMADRLR